MADHVEGTVMTYGQQPGPPYGGPENQQPGYQQPGYQQPGYQQPPTYGQQPGYGQPPAYGGPGNPYSGGAPGQPGYGGWSGMSMPRPSSVTAGGVLAIIGGVAATAIGLLFFLVAGMAGSDPSLLAGTGFSASIFSTLGIVVTVVGIAVLVFGILALKGKYWAALGLGVLGGIYVALAIWSVTQGQTGVIIGIGWIVISMALLLSGNSRAWFKAQQR